MTNVNSTNTNGSNFATVAGAGAGAAIGAGAAVKYSSNASDAIIKFADNLKTDTFIKSDKVASAVKKVKVPQMAAKVGNLIKEHPTKTAAIAAAVVAVAGGLIGSAFNKSNESVSGHQG